MRRDLNRFTTSIFLSGILSVRAFTFVSPPFIYSIRYQAVPSQQLLRRTMAAVSNSKSAGGCSGERDDSDKEVPEDKPVLTKIHTMTVCMVPPPQYTSVWEAVTRLRTEQKDPGLFRWPPHVNLLYPFLDVKITDEHEGSIHQEKLMLLAQATEQCEPFRVSLDSFGQFGGKSRGVLWLRPRSFELSENADSTERDVVEPLVRLQSALFQHFPECADQIKQGNFTPHMTVSHYPSLEKAVEGQAHAETWWSPKEFDVTEIYLLKRVGDDGQFQIMATLPLGRTEKQMQLHDPPIPFPDMPMEEEEWVREERMKMKVRRNSKGGRVSQSRSNRNQKERRDKMPSRSTDTPEVIAQKQAERTAKRERLARNAAETQAGYNS